MLTEAALAIVLILHLLASDIGGCISKAFVATLPSTALVDILSCLKRRDLDVLELCNQALSAIVDTHEKHLPRRSLSLMFFNEGDVSLISFKDTTKQVPVMELPPYLPRSVITKMLFRPTHTVTKATYKGLRACREYFADEAACFLPSTFKLPKGLLLEFFTTLVPCHTLILPHRIDNKASHEDTGRPGDLPLNAAALPCLANCASLQIEVYYDEIFDADGALAWLLGTHSTIVRRERHLSLKRCIADVNDFCRPLISGIEQQFADATSPASFKLELSFLIREDEAEPFGETRESINTNTHEKLSVGVEKAHRGWAQQAVRIVEVKINIHRQPLC